MATADSLRTAAVLKSSMQVILFDLDGTLVFHEPDSFDVISEFCAEIGQPLSPEAEQRGRRMRHEYFVDPVIRDQMDGLSRDQFWHHFNHYLLEAMGIRGDLNRLAGEVTERFANSELVYICPDASCGTLAELRIRGYRLGLVTNRQHVSRFHELLNEMGLGPYFDVILAAGEVGTLKPEPDIFYAALERFGVSAKQSLYVGDNYWADVVGARRAGVTPVLFDPHNLFPEANCLIVEQIDDLLAWLPGRQATDLVEDNR